MASTVPSKLVAVPAGGMRDLEPAHDARNPGTPPDLEWVADVRVNLSAVERRAATVSPSARRSHCARSGSSRRLIIPMMSPM